MSAKARQKAWKRLAKEADEAQTVAFDTVQGTFERVVAAGTSVDAQILATMALAQATLAATFSARADAVMLAAYLDSIVDQLDRLGRDAEVDS